MNWDGTLGVISMSSKINNLSDSPLRKRFFENTFVAENNYAVESIRVSTKRQERGKSFEDQAEVNLEYLKKANLQVIKSWEVAESASKHESRKRFLEMLEFVRASQSTDRPIKHAIFRDQSRSNRNRRSARGLEDLMELGVTLHFSRDNRCINNKSDLGEYLQWVVENYKNESFISDLTKNSMGGTIKCIERGCYPGSKLPFGYRSVGRKDRRCFELDGDHARYMQAAFEIVDSYLFEAERLTDRTLKEKLDGMFPAIGKTPHWKRFCELLRNPFYTGEEFIYDKTIFKSDRSLQPTLVDRQRWLRVQEKLNGRTRTRTLSKKLPYTGMMTCNGSILDEAGNLTDQVCGCAVTGERVQKKYVSGKTQEFDYYRCSNQTRSCSQRDINHMRKVADRKVSFRDSEIEIIFQDIFKSFSFDEVTCQKMKQFLWDEHYEAKNTSAERLAILQERQVELKVFIDAAYEHRLKGLISEELWQEKTRRWELEHSQIVGEISSLKDSTDEYMTRGIQLIELMQHAEMIFKNATPEKKRKMVELVSSNLLLKDGTLEYHWRKPFEMLAIKGDLEGWRPLVPRLRTELLEIVA